jgi:energy-coupling factor transporter ATP-binding protein EcfA2
LFSELLHNIYYKKRNNLKYGYWGFGLHIESEIEFPELLPTTFAAPDVKLYMASVPDVAGEEKAIQDGFTYVLNDTQLLFVVPDVARYLAQNGDTIMIEAHAALTEMRMLRLFTLATIFAAILTQRKKLPMHASAILHHNELVLICGDSGAGKSTTLAGLIKNNHTVFSDDVVAMDAAMNTTASYPMIKLWEDAQDKLAHDDFEDRSFVIKPGMKKYGIFFHDKFDTANYPVKKVLILKKGAVEQITSVKVTATNAFKELSKQVYRPMLIHNNELRALQFAVISALVNTSIVYQITRPVICKVDDLVQYVENMVYNEA